MVWHLKPCYSWWRDRIRSWSPLGHWQSPTLDGRLLGRPPGTIFPFFVSFSLVSYLERGLTQIKFKSFLHCPIWLYLSNTLRFNQFKRVNIQTNSFPPLLEDLISEPGGKAFVEPQVAPPTHCHQVAKPLGTMPSGQLDPIGQLDNVQWTIGQLDNWIKIVLFNVHFARQLTWCANSCATI